MTKKMTNSDKQRNSFISRLLCAFLLAIACGGLAANLFPAGEGAKFEGTALPAYLFTFAMSAVIPLVIDIIRKEVPGWRNAIAGIAGAAVGSLVALCSLLINV